jgi:peptide/nickel transport system substrate-binding protein
MADRRGTFRHIGEMTGVLTLVATLAVVVSCRRDSRPTATSSFPTVLRVGVGPLSTTNPVDGLRQLSGLLSVEGLVRPSEDGRLQPSLAKSWTLAQSGRAVSVGFRSGVTFHDGTPFNAQAVAEILPDALRGFMGSAFADVEGITVSGENSVEIGFRKPSPLLMEALEAQIRKPGPSIIGTGPFMIAANATTEIRANRDYYLGRPTIDQIRVESYPSVRAAWADMLRDRIDMLYEVGLDALGSMETATSVSVFTFTRKYQYFIALNTESPVLRSRDVRQALNRAVDRAAVVRDALNGHGLASQGPFWMRHWALGPDLPSFDFDPQRAAASLAGKNDRGTLRAGNVHFTCLVPPDAVYERIALEVKRQLANVGVDMAVEQVSLDRLFQSIKSRTFEAALMEGLGGPTLLRPYQFWHSDGVFNPGGLGNASIDAALDRLREAASDSELGVAAAEVQQAFIDDPPAIFLAWIERARAVSKRFKVVTDPGRPDVLGTMRLWKPAGGQGDASPN